MTFRETHVRSQHSFQTEPLSSLNKFSKLINRLQEMFLRLNLKKFKPQKKFKKLIMFACKNKRTKHY